MLRWTVRFGCLALFLALLASLFWLRGALYHRWVRFPREAAAWAEIRADRQPVQVRTMWQEYAGIIHSHSALSHDCEVSFEEILEVLQQTGRDFICLSDHTTEGRADFRVQWRGLREGRLFIPGFEMRQGWMPLGVGGNVVLTNDTDSATLARQIADNGGLLFFAHPEEPREWDRPELVGMEIYNIHADFKDDGNGLARLLPDLLLNQRRYPEHVFRLFFDRPTANLERWDALNRDRPVVGIAGNDCHQNTGFRAIYTDADTLLIEDTSPETLREFKLNGLTRWLVRMLWGPLKPGQRLFLVQLDPYARMTRFVGTHVLARELAEQEVLEALRAGRAFVGFDALADSRGFLWMAETEKTRVVMGESMPFEAGVHLTALAPHQGRFVVWKDGTAVVQKQGRQLRWAPPGPGNYRVEVELKVRGEWVPWIYANPIRLR